MGALCNICGSVKIFVGMSEGYFCPNKREIWHLNKEKEMRDIENAKMAQQVAEKETLIKGAIRNPVDVRYDVIYPEFVRMMAKIGAVGAAKYGDLNWHKSRLTGANGPVNHIHKHLTSYEMMEEYDHKEIGSDHKIHLAAIAFNAMMEYWYCENLVAPTHIGEIGINLNNSIQQGEK